eukprot:jgi/Bigna1/146481/aug1.115_g21189
MVHNSRLSKNPFENFKKRYRATATSMGGGVVVVGVLFYAINLRPWIIASAIVGISFALMFGFFVYGMRLSSMVLEKLNDMRKAQRFERMVYWVTGSMFLSCCCNIIMLAGREIYILFLFSLCSDVSSLTAVLYMFKDNVSKLAGNSAKSSSSRATERRGGSHLNGKRSGPLNRESNPMGHVSSRHRVQMSISHTRNSTMAYTRGRIVSMDQQRGRLVSTDQPRQRSCMLNQSGSASRSASKVGSSIASDNQGLEMSTSSTSRKGSEAKRRLTNIGSNASITRFRISSPSPTRMRGRHTWHLRSSEIAIPEIAIQSSGVPSGSRLVKKKTPLHKSEAEPEEQWKNYAI